MGDAPITPVGMLVKLISLTTGVIESSFVIFMQSFYSEVSRTVFMERQFALAGYALLAHEFMLLHEGSNDTTDCGVTKAGHSDDSRVGPERLLD